MMLAARDLSVLLGDRPALDGVSVALRPGTVTAICGPNGAGKSTLLSALAGLTAPRSGAVVLGETELADVPPRDRARIVGYLPQGGDAAWNLSVYNLVALGRLPHGDRSESDIAGALEAVHLTDMAERPIATLSGGEKARALLARVFAGSPDWILADEPLAALDFYHQHEVLASLRAAAGLGKGVVLVLHDLSLAMNHADRVVVLDRGQVAADGQPEQALSAATITRVWKIGARWLGEAGTRALVTG